MWTWRHTGGADPRDAASAASGESASLGQIATHPSTRGRLEIKYFDDLIANFPNSSLFYTEYRWPRARPLPARDAVVLSRQDVAHAQFESMAVASLEALQLGCSFQLVTPETVNAQAQGVTELVVVFFSAPEGLHEAWYPCDTYGQMRQVWCTHPHTHTNTHKRTHTDSHIHARAHAHTRMLVHYPQNMSAVFGKVKEWGLAQGIDVSPLQSARTVHRYNTVDFDAGKYNKRYRYGCVRACECVAIIVVYVFSLNFSKKETPSPQQQGQRRRVPRRVAVQQASHVRAQAHAGAEAAVGKLCS